MKRKIEIDSIANIKKISFYLYKLHIYKLIIYNFSCAIYFYRIILQILFY